MRKPLAILLTLMITFSTLAIFSPTVDAQGAYLTDFVQLTTNPYPDRAPFWSPDGSKIAYFAHADDWYRHIWVMNMDGSGKTQLTSGNVVDVSGDYSPDGTKIVFMRYRGGTYFDLMLMDSDGNNILPFLSKASASCHRPRWSNDGQRIAFVVHKEADTVHDIHIIAADGTNEIILVSTSYHDITAAWSADDTTIVYTMDDGIWLVNTSPPYEKTHLYTTSLPAIRCACSPDEKYILFSLGEQVEPPPFPQNLYLIDVYGSFIAQLTYDNMQEYPFDWSPDGQYVVFGSKRSGNTDIWRAKIVIETPSVRAWKDETSLGLENDHLLLHGSAVTGNYLWFFDYLTFKDTGTKWYQPWGELAILVYPNFQWKGTVTTDFEVNAFTDADKAYLKYSITSGNLREELTYTIYPGESYIYATLSLTNIGSVTENTYAGVQFTTWIAGDHANDYFYVPGVGQGQFTGVGNVNFPDANETWIAEWDQNKGEGCGMLSTKGFNPNNMITEDFGIGEGFKFISDSFDLAPGQSSAVYDCYLYFFTGTGWQKTKDFYNTLGVILDVPYENQDDTGWCGPTCLAMVLRYYGMNFHSWDYAEDQDLPEWGGLPTVDQLESYVHNKFTNLEVKKGIYEYTPSKADIFTDIKSNITLGYPVILRIGTDPPIPWAGHFIVTVGFTENGLFINDPSGALFGSYYLSYVDQPLSYSHVYVEWDNIKQFIVTWPLPTLLAIQGTPDPIDGTLYFSSAGAGDISFYNQEKPMTDYTSLDLDKGLRWKHKDEKLWWPRLTWLLEPQLDSFLWKITVSNSRRYDQSYKVSLRIEGLDGREYYKKERGISVEGYQSDSVTETIISKIPEMLTKTQWYRVEIGLSRQGVEIDSFYSPWIYYLKSGLYIKLQENQHKLYLHVYDSEGRHIGFNPQSNQIEIEIPDGVYFDLDGTITIVIPEIVDLTVVVDARYAEDPLEYYNLTVTSKTDIEFYSQTYSGNITIEESQTFTVEVSETGLGLYVWQCIFKDSKRGTELRINVDEKYFQFVAPDKMFSVKYDPDMFVYRHVIIICYKDTEIKLFTTAVDSKIDSCVAYAKDMQTGKTYWLIDKPKWRGGCPYSLIR